jgi:flagellar basal-body rod protein FlgC
MSYLQAFAISASGMAVEKARVDLTAANLANAHATRTVDGSLPQPMRLVSMARAGASFPSLLAAAGGAPGGAEVVAIAPLQAAPRLVYEPGHSDADDKGFVAYPGINPVTEMVTLLTAVRAYEANVAALNAAKTMALRTLQLGS